MAHTTTVWAHTPDVDQIAHDWNDLGIKESDRSIETQTQSLIVSKFFLPGFSMVSLDPVGELPTIDPQMTAPVPVVGRPLVEPIPERAAGDAQLFG
jgi:hypothetical protein